jgi:hypothetical protein
MGSNLIYFGLIFLLGVILIFGFVTFDQLVRLQYAAHYQAWIEDHQPDGFLWRPPGRSWFYRMNYSGSLCFLLWLFVTPQWVKQDDTAERHLRQLRICILVWNIGFVLIWLWGMGHSELLRKY